MNSVSFPTLRDADRLTLFRHSNCHNNYHLETITSPGQNLGLTGFSSISTDSLHGQFALKSHPDNKPDKDVDERKKVSCCKKRKKTG